MIDNTHKKIYFRFYDSDIEEHIIEGVWATKVDGYFKLDNIPFHAYLYADGDIVETELEDDKLIIKKLIEASGNSTIRLLFDNDDTLFESKETLNEQGIESETSIGGKLLAVNIPVDKDYFDVKVLLEAGERNGIWAYEEACISEKHQQDLANIEE